MPTILGTLLSAATENGENTGFTFITTNPTLEICNGKKAHVSLIKRKSEI